MYYSRILKSRSNIIVHRSEIEAKQNFPSFVLIEPIFNNIIIGYSNYIQQLTESQSSTRRSSKVTMTPETTITSAGDQTGESSSSGGSGGATTKQQQYNHQSVIDNIAPEISGGQQHRSKKKSPGKGGSNKNVMAHTTVFLGFRDDFDLTDL
jgi:hypothetical protein